jgi:Ca2+-transporting ATPase
LWINLLSDVLPAMGLAMTPPDPGMMDRPLRASDAQVLSGADLPLLVRDGAIIAATALSAQTGAAVLRGSAAAGPVGFTSLVAGQLLYALACAPKGRVPSGSLIGTLAAAFGAQVAALAVPGLRRLVGGRLGLAEVCLSTATGLMPLFLVSALDHAGPGLARRPQQFSEASAPKV